jgi:hypothetical protein
MGAALTYARRYALFTLVGIAGEEDMDAPDLAGRSSEASGAVGNRPKPGKPNGTGGAETLGSFAANRKPWSPPKQLLEPSKSAALRDQMLGELESLNSRDEATAWAQRALGAKNTLTTADSGLVEAAFASRLAGFADGGSNEEPLPAPAGLSNDDPAIAAGTEASPTDGPIAPDVQVSSATPAHTRKKRMRGKQPSVPPLDLEEKLRPAVANFGSADHVHDAVAWHIDKSALTHSEPRRYRDRAHLEFVSSQPCLLCGRRPSDAHHLRFAQPRALGRRVSDEFTVPLCRSHHRVLHRRGDEPAWWESVKLDPVAVARRLWERTRLNGAPVHRNIGTSPSAPLGRELEERARDETVAAADGPLLSGFRRL